MSRVLVLECRKFFVVFCCDPGSTPLDVANVCVFFAFFNWHVRCLMSSVAAKFFVVFRCFASYGQVARLTISRKVLVVVFLWFFCVPFCVPYCQVGAEARRNFIWFLLNSWNVLQYRIPIPLGKEFFLFFLVIADVGGWIPLFTLHFFVVFFVFHQSAILPCGHCSEKEIFCGFFCIPGCVLQNHSWIAVGNEFFLSFFLFMYVSNPWLGRVCGVFVNPHCQ